MLVITRKRDEGIMIGDTIEIRVLRTGQDAVRLGIIAPADIAVHRHEIYQLIRAANESAAVGTHPVSTLVERLRGSIVSATKRSDHADPR